MDIDNRNLAIHYDKDPFKVYEYYQSLSEDVEAKRVNKFLELIDKLVCFLSKYLNRIKIELKTNVIPTSTNLPLLEQINVFTPDIHNFFDSLGKSIEIYSKNLDKMVHIRKMQNDFAERVNDKFGIDKIALTKNIEAIIDDMKPGILVLLIYLDLCSAIRAYLSSESYCEKQLNLRHIEVIVYEGCRHLYGFDEKQREKSFWQTKLLPALHNSNDEGIKKLLTEIQEGLEKISSDNTINNTILRVCFVHYRYMNRDNVVTLFEESEKSVAIFELNKAVLLLKILPRVLNINEITIQQKHQDIKEQSKRTQEEFIEILRMPLNKITDPHKKKEFEEKLHQIISIHNKFLS